MRVAILSALAGVLGTVACARADLEVAAPIVNLGEIRGGMPAEVAFSLRNAGAERIEILEVNRGCDCLTPRLQKRLLESGEKTTLGIGLRTLGHSSGQHTWTTAIRFREGAAVRDISLGVRAVLVNDITIEPAVCALFVEKTLRQEITLTDRRQPPLTVTGVETSTPAIKALASAPEGGVTKIILEASAAGLAPGRHDEILSIYTSDPSYRLLQVPITLVRVSQSPVLATPEEVRVFTQPGQPIPATVVRLRPRGDGAVVIDKVIVDDPAVVCTWAPGPGNHATLKIQIKASRPVDSAVRVHLRQPVVEILTIPVQVRPR
jgi:hypothetical protein